MKLLRILFALAASAVASFAQTGTAIPGGNQSATYVISKPGRYYLAADRTMTVDSNAIEIKAPDVTLDLNGFSVGHTPGTLGGGNGIYAPAAENIEIRNGSIINTANYGIKIDAGKGVRIIDVRIASPGYGGLRSDAEDNLVDRCSVSDSSSNGIYVGQGSIIQDTIVSGCKNIGIGTGNHSRITRCTSRANERGIQLSNYCIAENCVLTGNTAMGIYALAYTTIRENTLHNNAGVGIIVSSVATGVDITGNKVTNTKPVGNQPAIGIRVDFNTTVLTNNRLVTNGINVAGSYVNGGGNILQ